MGQGVAWKHDWEHSKIFQSISPTSLLSYITSAIYLHPYRQIFSSSLLTDRAGPENCIPLSLESPRIYLYSKLRFDLIYFLLCLLKAGV